MFWENLQNWFFVLSAQYGIDPLIFGVIYIGTIPFFWMFAAQIVRNYRRRKSIFPASFGAAFCSLSSYIYLVFAGRNVSVWIYVAIVGLIIFAVYASVKKIRRQIQQSDIKNSA